MVPHWDKYSDLETRLFLPPPSLPKVCPRPSNNALSIYLLRRVYLYMRSMSISGSSWNSLIFTVSYKMLFRLQRSSSTWPKKSASSEEHEVQGTQRRLCPETGRGPRWRELTSTSAGSFTCAMLGLQVMWLRATQRPCILHCLPLQHPECQVWTRSGYS